MKAILLTAYGDVGKLELRDVADPVPGPNEICVRMAAASINPVDWKLRSGALASWMPLELPAILGRDVSGIVTAVGQGVTAFKVGARVMGLVNKGYAELVVAPVEAWAEVPVELDLVEAGALPLALLTGAQLIEEGVRPRQGDVVLVTGAVGSVGRAAVFVATLLGAKVWAGVRTKQIDEARKLDVEGVIALDEDAELSKMPLLDGIADTVGGEAVAKLFDKMKRGGTLGSVVGEPAGAKERGLVVRGVLAHPDAKRLAQLADAVAKGRLDIPVAKKLPLGEARMAQTLAQKSIGGKVVLLG
jgi:NADPH:quinone reductase-like Zn-dependent oxidoreductase